MAYLAISLLDAFKYDKRNVTLSNWVIFRDWIKRLSNGDMGGLAS